MKDFSDIAGPLVDSLVDDPDRGPPEISNPTTLPDGLEEINGQIVGDISVFDDDLFENGGGFGVSSLIDRVQPEDLDAGQRIFREMGVDVLAFYKSFRFKNLSPFKGHWGIFLIDAGIASVTSHYRAQKPSLSKHEAVRLATNTLLNHEKYHFWIDAWSLAQEINVLSPREKKYEYYLQSKQAFKLTSWDLEESLANHYLFKKMSKIKLSDGSGPARIIANFLKDCPEPYRDFRMDINERRSNERILAGAIETVSFVPAIRIVGPDPYAENLGRIIASSISYNTRQYPLDDISLCPVALLQDSNFAARVAPFQGPDLREMKRFITNYLSGNLLRTTDHSYFKIDNGETVKFPDPHVKTTQGHEFKNILHKAGMQRMEFQKERQVTKNWTKGCPRPNPVGSLGK